MTQTATRKQTEIQQAAINRVNSKDGKFLGYLMKSDSSEDYYEVTWNEKGNLWKCNCPATVLECKHCRAASQVCQAKAEMSKQETPACPISQELKTSFASIEEEFEYKLGAYGKKIAYGWLYEQKHAARTATPDEVAAVEEVKAEAKMDAFRQGMDEQYASDPRAELAKQIEAEETAASNLRAFYNGL